MPKQEWEERLLISDEVQKTLIEGIEIEYKQMPWMNEEDIQSKYLMRIDAKNKAVINDMKNYALEVLRWGIVKGPWPEGSKEAVIIKFKGNVKDELVRLITCKKDNTNLKKK